MTRWGITLVPIWCSSFLWTTPCFQVGSNTLTESKINTWACPSANTQYHLRQVGFCNICWHYGLLKHFCWVVIMGHWMKNWHQTNKSASPCCMCTLSIWHWCTNTWVYLVQNHVWMFWRELSRGSLRQFKIETEQPLHLKWHFCCLVITFSIIVFTYSIMFLWASIKQYQLWVCFITQMCLFCQTYCARTFRAFQN